MRPDREDLTAQQDRVARARAELSLALAVLAGAAKDAWRVASSGAKRPPAVPLGTVYEAHLRVQRAEEALDLAVYDLRTAGGEDG